MKMRSAPAPAVTRGGPGDFGMRSEEVEAIRPVPGSRAIERGTSSHASGSPASTPPGVLPLARADDKTMAREIKMQADMLEDVQPQQPSHRALGRQVMTNDIDIGQPNAQDMDGVQAHQGLAFDSACRDEFYPPTRCAWVAPDRPQRGDWGHRVGGSCVKCHTDKLLAGGACQEHIDRDDRPGWIEWEGLRTWRHNRAGDCRFRAPNRQGFLREQPAALGGPVVSSARSAARLAEWWCEGQRGRLQSAANRWDRLGASVQWPVFARDASGDSVSESIMRVADRQRRCCSTAPGPMFQDERGTVHLDHHWTMNGHPVI